MESRLGRERKKDIEREMGIDMAMEMEMTRESVQVGREMVKV